MWRIRAGIEQDWRALRMLLPQAFQFGSRSRSIVAATEEGLIVGAAAISDRRRSEPLSGPRVALHVVPPYRQRGIGRQLVEVCVRLAADEGAAALYAWQPMVAGGEEAGAWRRLGFDRNVIVYEGRGDVNRGLEYLKPRYERAVEEGWIPSKARLEPLGAEHAEQIGRLHVTCLGGRLEDIIDQVRGERADRYHPELSPVLLVDEKVMGFSLARICSPGTALVDSTVVHPSLRLGWANLWLKYGGGCACVRLGVHTLIYYAYDHHGDTKKLSRQTGAILREMAEPYMIIREPGSSASRPPGGRGGDIRPLRRGGPGDRAYRRDY
jgi:GNAT superfamily N-acetyltransferase